MMIKKILLAIILLSGITGTTFAQSPLDSGVRIILICEKIGGGEFNSPMPRGPLEDPLTIGLEDHTLYMSNVDFDVTLQLTDANDNVVYTTFVAANTSTVVLPSSLSGEYKLELIDDERCFWGYIEL